MNINERNQSVDDSMHCDGQYAVLLNDLIDGTLSEEKSADAKAHMESCETCRSLYQLLLQASILTNGIKNSKTDYISSMSAQDKEQQISRIKQRLLLEKEEKDKKGQETSEKTGVNIVDQKTMDNPSKKRKILLFKPRNLIYASTAAGFAILFLVAAIFIRSSGNLHSVFKIPPNWL